MKLKLILPFFLLLVTSGFFKAQSSKTIAYFNKNGRLAFPEESYYYRVNTDTAGYFFYYYTANSVPYFKGQILNYRDSVDQKNKYTGLCTWYFENGLKKLECNYNKEGVLHGLYTEFHNNGALARVITYDNGKISGGNYKEYSENGDTSDVFVEDFSKKNDLWYSGNKTNSYASLKLGGLLFNNSTDSLKINTINYSFTKPCVSIEVITNQNYFTPESNGGLVFSYHDPCNYKYFTASKKRFYVGSMVNGKLNKQIEGYFSEAINAIDWNKIKITQVANKLLYSINNIIVFSETINGPMLSKTGVIVGPHSIGLFDNYTIRESSFIDLNGLQTQIPFDLFFLTLPDKYIYAKAIITGLILDSKNGIALSVKNTNVDNLNNLTILAKTIGGEKEFKGELITKSVTGIYALKINKTESDSLYELNCNLFKQGHLDLQSELFAINSELLDSGFLMQPSFGKLKSKARFETLTNSFDSSIPLTVFSTGSPVFTADGELLGMIHTPAKNCDNDENSKSFKLSVIQDFIFYNRIKCKLTGETGSKPPLNHSEIIKSTVLIFLY